MFFFLNRALNIELVSGEYNSLQKVFNIERGPILEVLAA
jgi:hypothetical protein